MQKCECGLHTTTPKPLVLATAEYRYVLGSPTSRGTSKPNQPKCLIFSTFPKLPPKLRPLYSNNGTSVVAQTIRNLPAVRKTPVWSFSGKIPQRRAWQPIPVFLPGESHGEEPGRLQSMGSQKVGLDWAANTFTLTHSDTTSATCYSPETSRLR